MSRSNQESHSPLMDSQETIMEASQDLFSENADDENQVVQVQSSILKEILKELKDLKEMIASEKEKSASFRVEDQPFHKEFFAFLKGQFSRHPWLDVKDSTFKKEVKKHIGDSNVQQYKELCSFSARKYTMLRNQYRRMLFNSVKDIQSLSISELSEYLYKGCGPASLYSEEKLKNTVAVRHFLSCTKFTKTNNFWEDFRAFRIKIDNDDRENKWERLKDIEDRRIKRYKEGRLTREQI